MGGDDFERLLGLCHLTAHRWKAPIDDWRPIRFGVRRDPTPDGSYLDLRRHHLMSSHGPERAIVHVCPAQRLRSARSGLSHTYRTLYAIPLLDSGWSDRLAKLLLHHGLYCTRYMGVVVIAVLLLGCTWGHSVLRLDSKRPYRHQTNEEGLNFCGQLVQHRTGPTLDQEIGNLVNVH